MVCPSVIVKPRQWGGPGPLGAVEPWEKKIAKFFNILMPTGHVMHQPV